MPIFKLNHDKLTPLNDTTFELEHINEARDLQKFIVNSIETIEKDLFVLSSEFGDWEESRRRIDILCLDKEANLVVIELKRTVDGGHMELQSIRYAAMVANMTFEKAVKAHEVYVDKLSKTGYNAEEEILDFLEWPENNEEDFANDVRIILVSADFSIEITTSVLWLIEREIDIKCIRIKPQRDGENLYFDIQQIIPLPETADYQVTLREKVAEQRQARKENQRDRTKYIFENDDSPLGKGRFVLTFIKKYVEDNPDTFDNYKIKFPNALQGSTGVINTIADINQKFAGKNSNRHFTNDDEILTSVDNIQFAVSTEWKIENIQGIIELAKKEGYSVKEV